MLALLLLVLFTVNAHAETNETINYTLIQQMVWNATNRELTNQACYLIEPPEDPGTNEFNGTITVNTPTSCNKQFPCGFTIQLTNVPPDPISRDITILLLEDDHPIKNVYRDQYQHEGITYHVPYSVEFTGNGTVSGTFQPGPLLQVGKTYSLKTVFCETSDTSNITIQNFRPPDLIGDGLMVLTTAGGWIILAIILMLVITLVWYAYLMWRGY